MESVVCLEFAGNLQQVGGVRHHVLGLLYDGQIDHAYLDVAAAALDAFELVLFEEGQLVDDDV